MSHPHSISDLAHELGVTTRTIRFYEEQGMLAPERKGQERVYSARDRVTLMLILRGKRIGFSLAECKQLIDRYDPAGGNRKLLKHFLEKITERREHRARQLLCIQQMQCEQDTAEQRCLTAMQEMTAS